jgi:hypothetical protein
LRSSNTIRPAEGEEAARARKVEEQIARILRFQDAKAKDEAKLEELRSEIAQIESETAAIVLDRNAMETYNLAKTAKKA